MGFMKKGKVLVVLVLVGMLLVPFVSAGLFDWFKGLFNVGEDSGLEGELGSGGIFGEDGSLKYPKGSWGEARVDSPLSDGLKNNNGIVGVMLTASWEDIETSEGNFDWTNLDARVEEAKNADLKIVLKLITSLDKCPDWLKGDSRIVNRVNLLDIKEARKGNCVYLDIPVFWDNFFHSRKKSFIQEAGNKYSSDNEIVGVMTSFANTYSCEWNIPHVRTSYCGGANLWQDWLDAGYTHEKMLNIGKEIIDTTANAFPNQNLKLPIAETNKEISLAEDILVYAYGKYSDRFYAQANKLSKDVSLADDNPDAVHNLIKQYSPNVGLQMIASATNCESDGCRLNGKVCPCGSSAKILREVIDIGLSYNPSFIEYWEIDSKNLVLYDEMEYATEEMGGGEDFLVSGGLKNEISLMLPKNLNFATNICGVNDACGSNEVPYDKNVYTKEILISSTLEKYEPKKLRFFVWEK